MKRGKKDKNATKDTSKDISAKNTGKEVPKGRGKDKTPGMHISYEFVSHSKSINHILGKFFTEIFLCSSLNRKSKKNKQIRKSWSGVPRRQNQAPTEKR